MGWPWAKFLRIWRNAFIIVSMIALSLLAVTAMTHSHGKTPGWMDWTLAGYSFAYDDKHRPIAVRDPKTGFYLVRDVVCDGGILTLLLTRDHKLAGQYALEDANGDQDVNDAIAQKALPNLATGHGLRMGDSEARMNELLGKPGSRTIEGDRDQFTVYHYKWNVPAASVKDVDSSYEEKYTFKKGQLIEIEFDRDSE